MSPCPEQTFDPVTADTLLEQVRALRQQNYRLVQIGATRLPDQLELTYSFDLDSQLKNLRLHLPATGARVPSISAIYWCAFLYENEIHDLFGLEVDNLAVDFHGNLYQTAVKFPFGMTKIPAAKAPVTAPAPPKAQPAPPAVSAPETRHPSSVA